MIKSIDESYNGAANIHVSNYRYNELGQFAKKNLNNVADVSYLQSVDFLGIIYRDRRSISIIARLLLATLQITMAWYRP